MLPFFYRHAKLAITGSLFTRMYYISTISITHETGATSISIGWISSKDMNLSPVELNLQGPWPLYTPLVLVESWLPYGQTWLDISSRDFTLWTIYVMWAKHSSAHSSFWHGIQFFNHKLSSCWLSAPNMPSAICTKEKKTVCNKLIVLSNYIPLKNPRHKFRKKVIRKNVSCRLELDLSDASRYKLGLLFQSHQLYTHIPTWHIVACNWWSVKTEKSSSGVNWVLTILLFLHSSNGVHGSYQLLAMFVFGNSLVDNGNNNYL